MKKLFRKKEIRVRSDDSVEEPVMLDAEVTVPKTINPDGMYAVSLWEWVNYFHGSSRFEQRDCICDFQETCPVADTEDNFNEKLKAWIRGEKVPQYSEDGRDSFKGEEIKKLVAVEVPADKVDGLREAKVKLQEAKAAYETAEEEYQKLRGELDAYYFPQPERVQIVEEDHEWVVRSQRDDSVVLKGDSWRDVLEKLGYCDADGNEVKNPRFPPKYYISNVNSYS